MAIRDKMTYVLGTPEVPGGTTNIYVDVESDPNDGIVYLIGAVIDADGKTERLSFWADTKQDEGRILEQFIEVVDRYESPRIFAYGAHEKKCFMRARAKLSQPDQVNRVLDRLCNILAVVYSHIYFPTYSNRCHEHV